MKLPNELKHCRVFTATLPMVEPMTQHLMDERVAWRGIREHESRHAGFAVNPATGMVVTPLDGGHYHFCIRVDEKILPKPVVERKVEEKIVDYLDRYPNTQISKKIRSDFKEEVLSDMIRVADYKSRYIHCFYYQGTDLGRLFVARTSDADVTILSRALVTALSSVETRTIHIDELAMGLGTRIVDALTHGHTEDNLGPFDLGERIVLEYSRGLGGGKFTIAGCDLYECADEILEVFGGASLKEVELSHGGPRSPVVARISDKFHFKGLSFPAVDLEGEVGDDHPECWRQVHGGNLVMLAALVQDLADMMGYREPEQIKCKRCDGHFDNQRDYEDHLACGCPGRYGMEDLL